MELRVGIRQWSCPVFKHLLKICVHSPAVQDRLSYDFIQTRLGSFFPLSFEPTCPLGEKVGQAWRSHVHPHASSRAAYVNSSGDVKWSLSDIEVPTLEQAREDAIEIQDIRELGFG